MERGGTDSRIESKDEPVSAVYLSNCTELEKEKERRIYLGQRHRDHYSRLSE